MRLHCPQEHLDTFLTAFYEREKGSEEIGGLVKVFGAGLYSILHTLHFLFLVLGAGLYSILHTLYFLRSVFGAGLSCAA